jgi:predicted phosphoadenosine phosphosulfate sulfurtransferase
MATRAKIGVDVFEAALDRLVSLYADGHRLVYSFSGGKDSGVCLELGIMAATMTNRLPVDVIMRDDEIMYPGTFEYAERVAARPEVAFNWIYACQPVVNTFNRENPFFWVFDPLLEPDQWVRQPPSIAYKIPNLSIEYMTIPERFPPAPGKDLHAVIGLRTAESRGRLYGLFSSGSYVTKPNKMGTRSCRPIYDWSDADVWRFISEQKIDYNDAYDIMYRLGVPKSRLRIAPPTMNSAGAESLKMASQAWPRWFDRVCKRCPGVRNAAMFGKVALTPRRRPNETWQETFYRECVNEAPEWIKVRALEYLRMVSGYHRAHAGNSPLPEVDPCFNCVSNAGSWKRMAHIFYRGDPFSIQAHNLPAVQPNQFREGAGTWEGGSPTF